jgi:hypothetical protein
VSGLKVCGEISHEVANRGEFATLVRQIDLCAGLEGHLTDLAPMDRRRRRPLKLTGAFLLRHDAARGDKSKIIPTVWWVSAETPQRWTRRRAPLRPSPSRRMDTRSPTNLGHHATQRHYLRYRLCRKGLSSRRPAGSRAVGAVCAVMDHAEKIIGTQLRCGTVISNGRLTLPSAL